MGRLDRSFANSKTRGRLDWNARGEVVFSRRRFPRYCKRFNSKGKRRYGQFSMRPENRMTTAPYQAQFVTRPNGTTTKPRAD